MSSAFFDDDAAAIGCKMSWKSSGNEIDKGTAKTRFGVFGLNVNLILGNFAFLAAGSSKIGDEISFKGAGGSGDVSRSDSWSKENFRFLELFGKNLIFKLGFGVCDWEILKKLK
uniref:Uncharacterized protein n=1 Tax=Romanomermis culicivorax TaxID=13658 RepID=A0A915HUI1_ROMCU